MNFRNPRKGEGLTDYINSLADQGHLLTEDGLTPVMENRFNSDRGTLRRWLNKLAGSGRLRRKQVVVENRKVDVYLKD